MIIPFNKPYTTGKELIYIKELLDTDHFSGNGVYTKKAQLKLQEIIQCKKALLTHSCTAALEMAAILLDLKPNDEIIMPSYTFVSTANAFVLRGAKPVFVDIRPDTMNIDETKIEAAITDRTKAIVPVHYAGVSCEMDIIMSLANQYKLFVVEDAAHGIYSKYNNFPVGTKGHLAALSFHETKNIISGEGGALLINDEDLSERAEILWEKGTDRTKFFRGEVDKYTWVDLGSSFLPSEIIAAFLLAQLEQIEEITAKRKFAWSKYHKSLHELEENGYITRPVVPRHCEHNAHLYYILTNNAKTRTELLSYLKENEIQATSHYIPLHNTNMGKKVSRVNDNLINTTALSERLIRLPLWIGIDKFTDNVVNVLKSFYANPNNKAYQMHTSFDVI